MLPICMSSERVSYAISTGIFIDLPNDDKLVITSEHSIVRCTPAPNDVAMPSERVSYVTSTGIFIDYQVITINNHKRTFNCPLYSCTQLRDHASERVS